MVVIFNVVTRVRAGPWKITEKDVDLVRAIQQASPPQTAMLMIEGH
jgi:hypothetical protein